MSRKRRYMESKGEDDTTRLQYDDTSTVWPKRRFRNSSPNDFGDDSPEPDPIPVRQTQMWNTDKKYLAIWHKVNDLNGVCSVSGQSLDQMSQHLSSPDDPFWKKIGIPGCIMTGFLETERYGRTEINLRSIIPQDESLTPGACIWFRSTGVLPSNIEEAEKAKLSPHYLLPLNDYLGDMMEYERGGVIFPPLISEVYELIGLGEKDLLDQARAPQELRDGFKTWKSTSLASDWNKKVKVSPSADFSINIFECFMLYIHKRPREHGVGDPASLSPEAKPLNLEVPTRDDRISEGKETLKFVPQVVMVPALNTDPTFNEQVGETIPTYRLPHSVSKTYHEVVNGDQNLLKIMKDRPLAVDEPVAPRLKLHIEPVAHCMVVWMSLTRLKDHGWLFLKEIQELYEAIEWYLVLAESQTPCHMWDQKDRRPTHIPFDLPSKPDDASEVVRESQYDREIFGRTYLEYARSCVDAYFQDAAEKSRQEFDRSERRYLASRQRQSQLQSAAQPDEIGDGSTDPRPHIYHAEPILAPIVDCEHSECRDTLHQIDQSFVKLVDDIGVHFESLVEDKGLSEALKEMRWVKWDPERLDYTRFLHSRRALILMLMEECSGIFDGINSECKLRAMRMDLLMDDAPPEVRIERQHWARWRLREPSV